VHELVVVAAADGARVGEDGDGGDAAAVEDVLVGDEHAVVGHVQVGVVDVEAVEVLHGELARPHEAAAGARLVAELRLHLVDEDGQLAVALDEPLEEVDDDLLVRGAERQLAVAAVLEDEERLAEGLAAAGLLPQLDGLEAGQHDLLAAGGVHLLADDLADLEEGAPAEGKVAVDAGGGLGDEAGAQEELVIRRLGLGGGLAQGLAEEVSQAHAVSWVERWVQIGRIEERAGSVKERTAMGAARVDWLIVCGKCLFYGFPKGRSV
jgi:hypothetical protein